MNRLYRASVDFFFSCGLWYLLLKAAGIPGSNILMAALFALVQNLLFWISGLYRSGWRYLNLSHLWNSLLVMILTNFLFLFLVIYYSDLAAGRKLVFPVLINLAMQYFLHLLHRLGWFFTLNPEYRRRIIGDIPILIYGAGTVARHLLQDLTDSDLQGRYHICGFIDADPAKTGEKIGPYRIYSPEKLRALIDEFGAKEIWFTMPANLIPRRIVVDLKKYSITYKVVPRRFDQLITDLRNLNIEDLICRPEIRLNPDNIRHLLEGRRILVTGAAGSIGSELARQILGFKPSRLVLLDQWENGIFQIEREFERHRNVYPVIAGIRNEDRITEIFGQEKPEVVFHAAAYKHVPLMESNFTEAINTNVLGTFTLLKVANMYAAEHPETELRFINISTDKAVSPENIMGITKRISELLVYNMGAHNIRKQNFSFINDQSRAVRTSSVRFGNVLGSSGSAVQVFWQQIQAGGPVTVTHPEMERFFMTIPEAVNLVLHSLAVSTGEDILALDMGEPVRISDLAERLIVLAGRKPHQDIRIKYIGIRPGEKLKEELFWTKGSVKTENPHIFRSLDDLAEIDVATFIEKVTEALKIRNSLPWWKKFLQQYASGINRQD